MRQVAYQLNHFILAVGIITSIDPSVTE